MLKNSFVYNENASISNYVNGYVQTLQTMGLDVTNGTLMSVQEFGSLCDNDNILNDNDYSYCPSYLFETTYWLGSATSDSIMWYVDADGILNYYDYYFDNYVEVRPVITVSLS